MSDEYSKRKSNQYCNTEARSRIFSHSKEAVSRTRALLGGRRRLVPLSAYQPARWCACTSLAL